MTNGSTSFDIIFEGCKVVDGTGNPWYMADVAVRENKIADIGRLKKNKAKRRVNATDKVL